ncbi:MAG: hypothetical protein KAG20_10125 [Cocleimonas sp.]|nr:hypothetical protein [Cocleimonas sp.]
MKPRQELTCWSCGHQFSILLPLKMPANLIHPCPYCNKECLVEFEKNEIKTLYRGDEKEGITTGKHSLPDIMDTHQPH